LSEASGREAGQDARERSGWDHADARLWFESYGAALVENGSSGYRTQAAAILENDSLTRPPDNRGFTRSEQEIWKKWTTDSTILAACSTTVHYLLLTLRIRRPD
jgi:hypothetical protein